MDKKTIYADGVSRIHADGNVFRFKMMTLQPRDGQVIEEESFQLIMPKAGFIAALKAAVKLAEQLDLYGNKEGKAPAPKKEKSRRTQSKTGRKNTGSKSKEK